MNDLREIIFFKKLFLEFYLKSGPRVQKKYDHVFIILKQEERIFQ